MKHSKLYTHLGIAGALLVPALAVAAVEIPNVFKGGDPVSASQMNENFQAMADAIDALEARVDKFESAGLQAPVEIARHSAPLEDLLVIYQVHTDGILTARSMGGGFTNTTVRFDVSTDADELETCQENCTPGLARGYDGSSGSVFLPAGHYVALKVAELNEIETLALFWQPLRGPDPEGSEPKLIESSHP